MSAIRRLVGGRSAAVAELTWTSALPDAGMTSVPPPARGAASPTVLDHVAGAPVRPDRVYHGPRGAALPDLPEQGRLRD